MSGIDVALQSAGSKRLVPGAEKGHAPGRDGPDRQREIIVQTATRYGASRSRLFGSAARGDSGPDSDIDLLVDIQVGSGLLDLIAIKQDLEDQLGCSVDVLTESSLSPYLREAALREAVSL